MLWTVCSSKNKPVIFSFIESIAPPFLYASTGQPAEFASTGIIPKSSIPGNNNAFAFER